jgi:hypothetical protein
MQKGALLFVMRDYSHQGRAQTILNMRLFIRDKFRDVRNNGVVGKALWMYIRSITEPGSVSLDDVMLTQAKPSKRKRKAGDEDDEDEYKPSPIKSLGSAAKTRSKATKR